MEKQEGIRNFLQENPERFEIWKIFESALDRGRYRIREESGETEERIGKTLQWEELEDKSEIYSRNFFSGDYHEADSKKSKRPTPNELMRKFHLSTDGEATVTYLCNRFEIYRDEEWNQLLDDIAKGDITAYEVKEPWSDSERKLQELADKVQAAFQMNNLPLKYCKRDYIRNKILDMDEKTFINVFAPGIASSNNKKKQTIQIKNANQKALEDYLLRAFGRTGLDENNEEEFLLYLAQECMNSKLSCYQIFVQLKKYYQKLKAAVAKQSDFGDEKRNSDDFMQMADNVLERIESDRHGVIFSGKTCKEETIHYLAKELLIRYCRYGGKDYERIQEETLMQLLNGVLADYGEFVERYSKKKNKGRWEESDSQKLREKRIEIYGMEKQIIQNPVEETIGYIKKSTREIKGKQEWYVENNRVILKNVKIVSACKDITYSGKPGEKEFARGMLKIKCPIGQKIPKGTIFKYRHGTEWFLYQTMEEYVCTPFSMFCEYLYKPLDGEFKKLEPDISYIKPKLYEWMEKTRIDANAVKFFNGRTLERKRYYLLTLFFLKFAQKAAGDKGDVREEFAKEANKMLKNCGLAELYNGNRFDLFLCYLLANEDMVGAFREIWYLYNDAKEKAARKA